MTHMLMLTTDVFRDQHGDPATWTPADFESYMVISEIAPPPPPRYTYADMQAASAAYARSADVKDQLAARLAAEGRETAAGIHRRGAREARQHAAAARLGWPAYEEFLHGW